jgi:hypothetical protein
LTWHIDFCCLIGKYDLQTGRALYNCGSSVLRDDYEEQGGSSHYRFAALRVWFVRSTCFFFLFRDEFTPTIKLLPKPIIPDAFEERCQEDPCADEQKTRFAHDFWCDLPASNTAVVNPIQGEYAQRTRVESKRYYYRGLCSMTHRLPINHSGSPGTQLEGSVQSEALDDKAILDHPNLAIPLNGRFFEVEQ